MRSFAGTLVGTIAVEVEYGVDPVCMLDGRGGL